MLSSALNGKLYAVGGRNAAGEMSSVECYSPKTDEWCFVEKMPEPHYGHAGKNCSRNFIESTVESG